MAGLAGTDSTGTDMRVIKTDPLWNVQWGWSQGSEFNDAAQAVRQAPDGGFIACGHMITPDSASALALVRLDADGGLIWARTYPHMGGASKGIDVVPAEDGGFLAVGHIERLDTMDAYALKVLADGTPQWEKRFDLGGYERGTQALVISDDGYVILMSDTWPSGLAASVHLARIDAAGETVWISTFQTGRATEANGLLRTSDGGFLITGAVGPVLRDALLIRTGSEGQLLWQEQYGAPHLDEVGFAAMELLDGGFVIGGSKQVSGDAGSHAFLARINAAGDLLLQRRFPQGIYSEVRALCSVDDTCWAAFGTSVDGFMSQPWSAMRLFIACSSDLLVEGDASRLPAVGLNPNPAVDWVDVSTPGKSMARIVLWDAAGRVALDTRVPSTAQHRLSLSGLAAGTFRIGLYDRDGIFQRSRLVVIR